MSHSPQQCFLYICPSSDQPQSRAGPHISTRPFLRIIPRSVGESGILYYARSRVSRTWASTTNCLCDPRARFVRNASWRLGSSHPRSNFGSPSFRSRLSGRQSVQPSAKIPTNHEKDRFGSRGLQFCIFAPFPTLIGRSRGWPTGLVAPFQALDQSQRLVTRGLQ